MAGFILALGLLKCQKVDKLLNWSFDCFIQYCHFLSGLEAEIKDKAQGGRPPNVAFCCRRQNTGALLTGRLSGHPGVMGAFILGFTN